MADIPDQDYCAMIADLARVHDMMQIVTRCERCGDRKAITISLMEWIKRLRRELKKMEDRNA